MWSNLTDEQTLNAFTSCHRLSFEAHWWFSQYGFIVLTEAATTQYLNNGNVTIIITKTDQDSES